MAKVDLEYGNLTKEILEYGYEYLDKSRGVICKQVSSYNLELDNVYLQFPLLTTKKMYTKGIVGELLWFLRGLDNLEYLHENNIHIWDKDAENNFKGKLSDTHIGRNYGVQWRDWTTVNREFGDVIPGLDQISNLIQNLKDKPMSRRHIVTAWNPAELDETALPPCHWAFEIIPYPIPERVKYLFAGYDYLFDLKWHQRSVDTFLGLPFNITSYALLMRVIGELTQMIPNKLIGDLSNVHFYEPHIQLVEKQMENSPMKYQEPDFSFSMMAEELFASFRRGNISLDQVFKSLRIEDFLFTGYHSYPAIGAEMYAPKK